MLTRRVFDSEFKRAAVKLALESGKRVSEVARDLCIRDGLLHRWIKQMNEDGAESAFPGKGHLKPEDEELRRLLRELRDVTQGARHIKKSHCHFLKTKALKFDFIDVHRKVYRLEKMCKAMNVS